MSNEQDYIISQSEDEYVKFIIENAAWREL
jgi:hypothetical protein